MDPGLIWLLGGLLLLAAELALPGIFLLWVGVAAIGTGLFLLFMPEASVEMTLVVFPVLLAGGIWFSLGLRRGRRARQVNAPGSGLVGRSGLLLPPGDLATGPGLRVRIGDSEWQARLPRDVKVPEGPVRVRVEGVDGTTLLVRPE